MKTIYFILILCVLVYFSSCDTSENSKPYGPTTLSFGMKIVDKDGNDLLKDNLLVENDLVISPYKLTATCNEKTVQIKSLYFHSKTSILGLVTDLHDYNYMQMEGYTGILSYKLQLPTVFGDDRETLIDVKWKVKEKTILSNFAEIEEIYINGIKTEDSPVIMVVNK